MIVRIAAVNRRRAWKVGRGLLLPATLALLSFGCASTKSRLGGDPGKFYIVNAKQANFFTYGPQQGNGADEQLPHDTLMTLIQPSFGYCKVHLTKSGKEGYVASNDIKPAPPSLVAAVIAPPPTASPGAEFNLDSSDPRLVAPPEDLPIDSPEPTPLPGTSPQQSP
jgi:hypothetical protein